MLRKASDASVLLIRIFSTENLFFFCECHEFGDKLGQRQSTQALGDDIRVSASVSSSLFLSALFIERQVMD